MDKVEFYIDNTRKNTDSFAPYNWTWNDLAFGRYIIETVAYDNVGNYNSDEIIVWKF